MVKKLALVLWLVSAPVVFAGEPSSLIEPEEFSKLVIQRRYKEAHDTAVAEAKLVPEELEYVRGNKLVPNDKRYIYLRRPFEYYEVLLATKETQLAQLLEKEIFETLPEKTCVERMLEVSTRVNDADAIKRLSILKNQCKR